MTKRLSLVPVIFFTCVILSSHADDANTTNASPAVALPSSAPATGSAPAAMDFATARPATYTVMAGDTLWSVSHKFNTSIRAIKKLNKLKKDHLKPGQVLKIPTVHTRSAVKPTAEEDVLKPAHLAKSDKSAKPVSPTTVAKTKTSRTHHHSNLLVAQPVQDFDTPASTFASCPTPPSNGSDDLLTAPTSSPEPDSVAPALQTAPGRLILPPLAKSGKRLAAIAFVPATAAPPAPSPAATLVAPAPVKKNFANALADFFGGSHAETSETGAWGDRFLSETRNLAGHGIAYDQSWRPEGESHSWAMDCSNTTRYLYQVTAGIQLPRTASDQYYYLHLQDKAWDVPTVASGYADCNFLRSNLKPGDLLFWENTYRPDRQPPITHVMIFLGTNAKGQWIMAGSQSSHGGEFNPRRSGPDVYVFDPTHSSGGYTTWLGLVHHKGRFCAYGRPLEADVKKLSIADND